MSKKLPIILTLCALTLTLLSACGQNSKSNSATTPATLSGVAAATAPISGTVALQDSSSPAQIRTAETTSSGQYSFDVGGLKPPFMLSVESAGTGTKTTMHSFSDGAGMANINPLTDAAVMASDDAAGSKMPRAIEDDSSRETTYNRRRSLMDAIKKQLMKLFDLYGITSDPVSGDYESESSQYSELFKNITIKIANGTITVTNTLTGSVIFTASVNDIAGGTFYPQNMPNPPAAQDGASLYATYCSSCHGPLATSSKQDATAADIQSAITNLGAMNSLSSLTQQQIQAIAAALSSSPTPTPTPCTYTYSGWGTCQSNGTQTRTATASPAGCTGTPILSQTCTYVPPAPTPCTYTYSAWGTCQSNNTQTRTMLTSSPAGCTGTPVLSQSCTYVPPAPTLTLAQVTSACTSCHGLTVNTTVLKSGGYTVTGRTATTWLSTVNRMVGYGTQLAPGTTAQDYANFLAALP